MGILRPRLLALLFVVFGAMPAGAQPAKAPAAKPTPAATVAPKAAPATKGAKTERTKKPAATKTDPAPAKAAAPTVATAGSAPISTATSETTTERSGPIPVLQRGPSVTGANGLDRIWSADPGPEGTARLRLSLSYFDADDFLTPKANNVFLRSDFAVAYTPHRWVETFLSVRATSNTYTMATEESEARPQNELLQTQGDTVLGAKFGGFIKDDIAVAGAAAVHFASGVGGAGFDLGATNLDLRVIGTFDFTRSQDVPVRTHFEVSYLFENTENLFDSRVGEPTLSEEFGLQIARYDRLSIGLGLEIPFDQYLTPYADYRIEVPFLVELSRRGDNSNELSFSSIPHALTLGLRGFPLESLALDIAARIGFSDTPYTGVPATPPWQLIFGVGYTLDPRPVVEVRTITKKVTPKRAPAKPRKGAPKMAFVAGKVVDAKTKKPIAGARVMYPGHKGKAAQLTDGGGAFAGYAFPPGKKLRVRATAPGYGNTSANVTPKLEKLSTVKLALTPGPKTSSTGALEVRVFDDQGRPIEAKVIIDGKASAAGLSKPGQPLKVQVAAGPHALVVSKTRFMPAGRAVTVEAGKTAGLRIKLEARGKGGRRVGGARSGGGGGGGGGAVRITRTRIRLRTPVTFEPQAATLMGSGKRGLDALARALKKRTSLKRLRIAVHTDNQGGRTKTASLSNERARAVKRYLTQKGVASDRLQARGYGANKPIAPNFTARGRAKNNRVLFVILEGR